MTTALTPDAALAMCELWFEKHSPTAELINGLGRTEHPMLTMIKASLKAHAETVNTAPELLAALKAIKARINGEFDAPELVAFGALGMKDDDCLAIACAAIAKATT